MKNLNPSVLSRRGERQSSTRTIFIFSTLNMLVVMIQGIVLVPYYIKYAGTKTYGAWISTGDILVWMQAFDFGVSNYAIQMMSQAHAEGNSQALGEWFSSILAVLSGIGLLILMIGTIISGVIYRPFDLPVEQVEQLRTTFMLGIISTSLTLVSFALVGLSRATHTPKFVMAGTLVASIVGALAAIISLMLGAGILAAGFAMLARSTVILLSCLGFLYTLYRAEQFRIYWSGGTLRRLLSMMPASALGSISYAVGSQSDTLLAGYLFGPEAATHYMVNRRAADVGKSLLDTLTYSSFASLAGEYHESPRAGAVMFRGLLLRQAILSLVIILGYVLLNKIFLRHWVGERFFLGEVFTVLVALQVVASARSYFLNSSIRAVSVPKRAYNQLAGELITKLVLIAFTYRFGIEALLVSGSLAALVWSVVWTKDSQRLFGYAQWPFLAFIVALLMLALLAALFNSEAVSTIAVLSIIVFLVYMQRLSRSVSLDLKLPSISVFSKEPVSKRSQEYKKGEEP